jgi:F0F1-type ATP synthase assembly protein I
MPKLKKQLARKAVKSTAKHTAHGTAAKLKREPMRTASLLGIGALIGAFAGWMVAKLGADAEAPTAPEVQTA